MEMEGSEVSCQESERFISTPIEEPISKKSFVKRAGDEYIKRIRHQVTLGAFLMGFLLGQTAVIAALFITKLIAGVQ